MSRAPGDVAEFLRGFVSSPAFLAKYPYYAAVLAQMDAVSDPSVQRMAVSLHGGRFYLHVNVDAFLAEPQYLAGVLLHEVHHVVLGHLGHPKFAYAEEPELLDLALEMSANEYIEEPLPSPIVWKQYAAAGLRAGQSTLERYQKLVDAMRSGAFKGKPVPGEGEGRVDDHQGLGKGGPQPGALEQTKQLIEQAVRDAQELLGEGGDPRRGFAAGRSANELVEELTGVTGPLEHYLDWKTALAMFAAKERAPTHTYSRPSRRFPGRVGEVPGRAWSPRTMTRPRLLVAIDTSMSMSKSELAEVARHVAKVSERAEVTVVECDAEIHRVYPFDGDLFDVQGRGGTDLRPLFEPSFLGARRPDGVVYFTDGDGPFPDEAPPLPVLWVLTKPLDFACPWGQRAAFG